MARRYASGKQALGECGKSGIDTELKNLVMDGYFKGLLVLPEYYEPPDPQTKRASAADAIALRNPSPRRDRIGIELRFPTISLQTLNQNKPFVLSAALGQVTVDVSGVAPPVSDTYTTEDGLSSYVTEDGLDTYVSD